MAATSLIMNATLMPNGPIEGAEQLKQSASFLMN